jgi:hypothetical protein
MILALGAGRQQDSGHAGAHPDAICANIGPDHAHRVVDRETGVDLAAWRIEVDADVGFRIVMIEKEQLRHQQVGNLAIDRCAEKDDAVLEQPRVNVECSLAAIGAFDHHRHQIFDLRDFHSVVAFLH